MIILTIISKYWDWNNWTNHESFSFFLFIFCQLCIRELIYFSWYKMQYRSMSNLVDLNIRFQFLNNFVMKLFRFMLRRRRGFRWRAIRGRGIRGRGTRGRRIRVRKIRDPSLHLMTSYALHIISSMYPSLTLKDWILHIYHCLSRRWVSSGAVCFMFTIDLQHIPNVWNDTGVHFHVLAERISLLHPTYQLQWLGLYGHRLVVHRLECLICI